MNLSTLIWPARLKRLIYLAIFILCLPLFQSVWNLTKLIINHDLTSEKFHTPVIRMKSDIYLEIKEDIFKNDQGLLQKLQRNKGIYVALRGIVALAIIVAVLLQLKTLVSSFSEDSLFNSGNIRCVRRISYLLVTWLLTDLIFYICIPLFIPLSAVGEAYNFVPLRNDSWNITFGIISFLGSINYGVLLSAFAFYVISIVFSEGNMLKEQADLTI